MPGYRTQILCLSLGELQTQHFWGCLPSSPADRDTGRWAWSLAKVEELHWRQWWYFSFLQLPIWPSHFYKRPRGDDMKHKAWKSTELWLGNSPRHRLGDSSHKEFESRCEIPQSQDYSIPVSYVRQTSKINYWVNLAQKTQTTVSNSIRSLVAVYFRDMQAALCLRKGWSIFYPWCSQPGPLQQAGQASWLTHWGLLCDNTSCAQGAQKPQLQLCQQGGRCHVQRQQWALSWPQANKA